MSSGAEDFDVIDGGCQCSLVRYRVTLPRNSANNGVSANHCNCSTCGKTYSTLTHTSITIPVSCIQFATRVPYAPQSPALQSVSPSQQRSNELPPSYAASSIGSSSRDQFRRLSTSSTASSSSTSTITTIATVTSESSASTVTTYASSSSRRPSLHERGTSFIEVDTPAGCCTSSTSPSVPAVAGPPTFLQMLHAQPRPAYYPALAAEARRNPQSAIRSSSGATQSPRSGGVMQTTARANQVGGGVENLFFSSPLPSNASGSAGKKNVSQIGETINPLAAVTPPAENGKQNPSAPPSASPPSYSIFPQLPGVNITPTLTIPLPYKEFPLSPDMVRGFCGYCGGSLLLRLSTLQEDDGFVELAAGSLDHPERVLVMKGVFSDSSGQCLFHENDERSRLLKNWGVELGEGR